MEFYVTSDHHDRAELMLLSVLPAVRRSWLHAGSLCEMAVDTQIV